MQTSPQSIIFCKVTGTSPGAAPTTQTGLSMSRQERSIPHHSTRVRNDRPSLLGMSMGFTKTARRHTCSPPPVNTSKRQVREPAPLRAPGDQRDGSPKSTQRRSHIETGTRGRASEKTVPHPGQRVRTGGISWRQRSPLRNKGSPSHTDCTRAKRRSLHNTWL